MISPFVNYLFWLRKGVMRWRHSKAQLSVFVCSLTLLTFLITLLYQFSPFVFKHFPDFLTPEGRIASIVRADMSNRIAQIRPFELEKLAKIEGVIQVSSIGNERTEVKVNNTLVRSTELAFIDENLLTQLGMPEQLNALVQHANKAVVSHRFWEQHLDSRENVSEVALYIKEKETPFFIAGVLPQSMNKWSGKEFDIWLNKNQMEHFAPFRLDEEEKADPAKLRQNELYTIRYLRGAPSHYGFMTLTKDADLDLIMAQYLASDLDDSDIVHFSEAPHVTLFAQGVELDPLTKASVIKQWKGVLFLAALLGILILTGLIYTQITFMLKRKQELITKLALGAGFVDLMKEALAELTPMILISQGLAVIAYFFGIAYLADVAIFAEYMSNTYLNFSLSNIGLAFISVSSIVALSYAIPYLTIAQPANLLNTKNQTLTKAQNLLSYSNFYVQITISLLTLLLILFITKAQWDIIQRNTFNFKYEQISVFTKQSTIKLSDEHMKGRFPGFDPKNTSISFDSLINPVGQISTLVLNDDDKNTLDVITLFVGEHYFEQINAQILVGNHDHTEASVVVNEFVAEQIRIKLSLDSHERLLGINMLEKSAFSSSSMSVAAVVENIPHFGFENQNRAIIYRPYSDLPRFIRYGFTAYVVPSQADALENYLEDWAFENLGNVTIKRLGKVDEVLYEFEFEINATFFVASILCFCVLALVLFNLYNIVKIQAELSRTKTGILLAIGANRRSIFVKDIVAKWTLIIAAVPSALAISLLLSDFLAENLFIRLANLGIIVLAIALTLLLVLLIVLLVYRVEFSKPVRELLP